METYAPPIDFPEHVRPNLSRLEAHRSEVALARRLRWSCRVIAELLYERHDLRVSGRSVAYFCKRRGIVKGVGERREKSQSLREGRWKARHRSASSGASSTADPYST